MTPLDGAVRKPNIVLITTDDQTLASLSVMPRVQRLLVDRGVSFENAISSFPLCCPSRASWITGQFAHNHGVIDNQERNGGGYQALREPDNVLPAWLDQAGYDTALVGKWLHDYRTLEPPPGWDRFWALTSPTMVNYYRYEVTDSRGGKVRYGDDASDYVTDALTREYALPYIRQHARDPDPFFLHVSYIAPHWGRGRNDPAGQALCERQAVRLRDREGEARPSRRRRLSPTGRCRRRPRSMRRTCRTSPAPSVGVRGSTAGRSASSRSATAASSPACSPSTARSPSDRRRARRRPAHRSHLRDLHLRQRLHARRAPDQGREGPAVRGGAQGAAGDPRPGVAAGDLVDDPVANVDLAPTILELAEVTRPRWTSSARPTAARWPRTPTAGATPDRAVLIESKRPPRRTATGTVVAPSWVGVRTRRYTYVEHYRAEVPGLEEGFGLPIGSGSVTDTELYDLELDPRQLRSRHTDPVYAATRGALAEALAQLRDCAGETCRLDVVPPAP